VRSSDGLAEWERKMVELRSMPTHAVRRHEWGTRGFPRWASNTKGKYRGISTPRQTVRLFVAPAEMTWL
jgi:hypothetical protein